MSAATKVIEAARIVSSQFGTERDLTTGVVRFIISSDNMVALQNALKAYDARRAEMRAMPITGGG
jgi:hypothetical protein